MASTRKDGETANSPATAHQGISGETATAVPTVNVPDIPMAYAKTQEVLGTVPAEAAPGFQVTRIPNTPKAIAEAKSKGKVVVHAGDRNPLNPDEPLILNEEMFVKTPEGYLDYNGDILVVWSTVYAEKYRAAQAEAARKAAEYGPGTVKISKTTVEHGFPPVNEILASLQG